MTGCRREIELRRQPAWNAQMQIANDVVPLTALVMRVMGFVVEHDHRSASSNDPCVKIFDARVFRGRLWSQYGAHLFGFVPSAILALIELLDVREVEGPQGAAALALAAHVALKIVPINL